MYQPSIIIYFHIAENQCKSTKKKPKSKLLSYLYSNFITKKCLQ